MTVTRSLGMAALIWATQAGAMQIGNLETQSGLNEPLRARVLVSEMTEADARSLDVRIADDATYTRLGLVRAAAVDGLEFALNPNEDGSWSVDIVGQRAVRDPFIVLLLDVRSETGRALREFTVLLDPGPVMEASDVLAAPLPGQEDAAEEIPAPQVSVASAGSADASPPVRVPAPESTAVIGNQPVIGKQDYRYSTQPAPAAASAAYSGPGTEYGPIRRGESLSTVAKGISQETGVHVAQVMWSMYSANPKAFEGNINNLRVGARLSVPSTQAMRATSIAQSRINIRDAVNADPVDVATSTPASRNDTAAATSATPPPREVVREVARETVRETEVVTETPAADSALPAAVESPSSSGASSEALFDEPADTLVAEEATETPAEAAAPLADDGFTDDGSDADTNTSTSPESAPAPVQSPGPGMVEKLIGLATQWLLPLLGAIVLGFLLLFALAAARRSKRQKEEQLRAEQEAAMRPRPDLVGMARGQPIVDPTEVMPIVTAAAAGGVAAVAADAASEDEGSSTLSFDTAPLADAEEEMSAGAQLDAALEEFDNASLEPEEAPANDEDAAFAALLESEDPDESATPAQAASSDLGEFDIDFGEPPVADDADAPAEAASEPKSMFATASFPLVSDEKTEAASSVTDDPVGEAEFQLAYGLYDEAEQTLKAVLEADPGRLDAMEKLAEVYFAAGRQDDFEKLAMELKRDQGMTQEFRNVEALAQQLIPSSKLFDAPEGDAGVAPDVEAVTDDGLSLDLDDNDSPEDLGALDLPDLEAPSDAEGAETPAADPGFETVAFEIPDFESDETAPESGEETPADLDAERVVDFDLGDEPATASSDDIVELEPVADAEPEVEAAASDENDLSATVAFDIPEIETPAPAEPAVTESDDNVLEFNLDDFGTEELGEVEGADDLSLNLDDADDAVDLESLSEGLELDDMPSADAAADDIAFELDTSDDTEDALTLEPAEDDALSLEAFDDGISEGGDLNSKLDLARGYVDMGEIDMARSLLDEVASRGDADQQAEARKMLESLA